jgi:hypothetical protein
VPVPAGALLLWNSRTIHQGWAPGPRLAQPVCWEPKARRSRDALIRKAVCCIHGYPTTHWAALGFYHDFIVESLTSDDDTGCDGRAGSETAAHAPTQRGRVFVRKGQVIPFRWLRSFALGDGVVLPKTAVQELVDAAEAAGSESATEEAVRRLLDLIKPEIRALL